MKVLKLKVLSIVITLLELIAIFWLISSIITRPSTSISPTSREGLIFSPDANLKHFYEPRPNTFGRNKSPEWLKSSPVYTINADSLNERFDYSIDKPATTFRIATIGDSFTYGLFVNTEENWPEVLENLLNDRHCSNKYSKYEILNLGMTGFDIQYGAQRFKVRGEKYNPDMVIWFLKSDDFDSLSEYVIDQAEKDAKDPENKNKSVEILWADAEKKLFKEFNATEIEHFQEVALNSINNYFKETLLIYSQSDIFTSQRIDNKRIIKDFLDSRPNTYFYNSPTKFGSSDLSFPDGHPNVLGHKLIAEDILGYLSKNNLIRCDY